VDRPKPLHSARPLVLVASASPSYWHRVREALEARFAIAFAVDLQGALEILRRHRPILVVLGGRLIDADLGQALRTMGQRFPGTRTVLVTSGEGPEAVETDDQEHSAAAVLSEGEVADKLLDTVLTLTGHSLTKDEDGKPASVTSIDAMRKMVLGDNPRVQRQLEIARLAAPHDVCCLICGESGTGKEVLARWIHAISPRSERSFVAVDLPSIPSELFESVLFGHERGSFTGAVAQHQGKFQRAEGGTLFLDEISSLRPELQPKLLRALQEREVESVGGAGPTTSDARIIAATNTDLPAAVRHGEFRADLFYRLCVVTIRLLPLRERLEDLPAFVEHFSRKYAARFDRPAPGLSAAALRALLDHPWPGNIRELENRVQRAVLLSPAEQLEPEDLFGEWLGLEEDLPVGDAAGVRFNDCELTLAELEARYIDHVLKRAGGNQSQAAQLLQIDRKTLRSKLQKYRELNADAALRSVS
jgi:DNA-binding NtrC family response regulator